MSGKFYIGVHKSIKKIDKDYFGSGVWLKRAIKKYGIENFKIEILEYFESEEEMYYFEQGIVNESLVHNPNCYNMKLGGKGGWPLKGSILALEIGQKVKKAFDNKTKKEKDIWKEKIKTNTLKVMNTPEMKEKIKNGLNNRSTSKKLKQYNNIKEAIKKKNDSLTEEEKLLRRMRIKNYMSKPENRKKVSEGMIGSKKLLGYENPDFRKRWLPKYELSKELIISLANDDYISDHQIKLELKEKFNFGFKLYRVFNYYEYKNYIKIIKNGKIKENGILKNKTYIEVINENNC
jgi:hypothetical protein